MQIHSRNKSNFWRRITAGFQKHRHNNLSNRLYTAQTFQSCVSDSGIRIFDEQRQRRRGRLPILSKNLKPLNTHRSLLARGPKSESYKGLPIQKCVQPDSKG